MRYPASEKLEIIRLVEQSHLPVRRVLEQIGIPRSTFYRWCDLYQTGGPEALDDRSPRPDRVWNRIPDDVRARIVTLALDEPELSPRGRVEDWRAGVGRSLCSLLSRPFVCECPTISTMPRLQPPPRRTQRADFPHCAPPFASRQSLWDLSCWGDFRPVASHSIGVKQPSSVVQPPPIPSFPAEALSFLSKSSEPPGRFSLRLDV
jgi:transposase-like protein